MSHWALKYLGKPWQASAIGPDAFNCWTFCVWVERNEFVRECPEYDLCNPKDLTLVASKIEAAARTPKWIELKKPVEGCIVVMGKTRVVHHAGIYTLADGGCVIHCHEKSGVCVQTLSQLQAQGWGKFHFYIHRTWQPSS